MTCGSAKLSDRVHSIEGDCGRAIAYRHRDCLTAVSDVEGVVVGVEIIFARSEKCVVPSVVAG